MLADLTTAMQDVEDLSRLRVKFGDEVWAKYVNNSSVAGALERLNQGR